MKRPVAFEAAAARSTGSWAFPRGEGGRRCVLGSRTSVLRRRACRAGSASSPRFQPVWGLRAGGPHTVGFCTWWGLQSGKQLTGHGCHPGGGAKGPGPGRAAQLLPFCLPGCFPFSLHLLASLMEQRLWNSGKAWGLQAHRREAGGGRGLEGLSQELPTGSCSWDGTSAQTSQGQGAASLCSGATAAPGPSPARGPQTSALI